MLIKRLLLCLSGLMLLGPSKRALGMMLMEFLAVWGEEGGGHVLKVWDSVGMSGLRSAYEDTNCC